VGQDNKALFAVKMTWKNVLLNIILGTWQYVVQIFYEKTGTIFTRLVVATEPNQLGATSRKGGKDYQGQTI